MGLRYIHYGEPYNGEYGDEKICKCGHVYHRHFDSYEDMLPIGCKYCECFSFNLKEDNGNRFQRIVSLGFSRMGKLLRFNRQA